MLLVPTLAVAQDTPLARQGFGISFGIGSGSAGLDCTGCSSDRTNGVSGYLRIGGHVRPNLMIAGESNGWTKSEGNTDTMLSFISAVAQWYPMPTNGFYAKGGLGLSLYRSSDGTNDASANAGALTLGTGYDFRTRSNFSLTPFLNILMGMEGEMKVNGTGTGTNFSTNVVQLGLGFTWH